MRGSPHVAEWLHQTGVGLAVTTYQTNRLFLLGVKPDGTLSGFERLFDRPMGLHVTEDGSRITMATRYQIRELVDALGEDDAYEGYDRVYVPRRAHTTGELDAHDLHRTANGDIRFVNTRFSCVAAPSRTHSFRTVWTPPFISRVRPEDRCHLNGLALEAGRPRYATAVSRSDVADGWRTQRDGGGVVIDVRTNEVVAEGLTMPHSPRVHDGDLYLINAGTGELGRIDLGTGAFEPIAFCPGFGRGLALHDRVAIVGVSKPRGDEVFRDLPLGRRLREKNATARCGMFVIDLTTGSVAHWLTFTRVVDELYDVQVLPHTRRPMALGFKTDEIRRFITIEREGAPQRFQIALGAPDPSDATGDGQASPDLRSLELPRPNAAARAARIDGPSAYRFRSGVLPAEEAVRRFEGLVPPSLVRTIESGQIEGSRELWGIVALYDGRPVGLAAGLPEPDGQTLTVHALSVRPAHRAQGIATKLLALIEGASAKNGVAVIKAAFRNDLPSQPALERVFEKRGWSAPQVSLHVYKVLAADFVQHPTLQRREAPLDGTFVPWSHVSTAAWDEIERHVDAQQVPRALSPFQLSDRVDPEASVVLRTPDGIQGWMVTHRVADDILQYTALYVAPSSRERGAGLGLVTEAVHRQHERGDRPKCLWTVAPGNDAMRTFVDAHLAPVLTSHVRHLMVGKKLAESSDRSSVSANAHRAAPA